MYKNRANGATATKHIDDVCGLPPEDTSILDVIMDCKDPDVYYHYRTIARVKHGYVKHTHDEDYCS